MAGDEYNTVMDWVNQLRDTNYKPRIIYVVNPGDNKWSKINLNIQHMKNSQAADTATLNEQTEKIPALRKVKDVPRIIESLKGLSFDDMHLVHVELKSMIEKKAKDMSESAQATLDKIKNAGL